MAPHALPSRVIRTLPWLAGLLIGASAHVVWWSQPTQQPPTKEVIQRIEVPVPHAAVHVYVHHTDQRLPVRVQVAGEGSSSTTATPPGARGAVVCSDDGCTIRRDFIHKLLQEPQMLGRRPRLVPVPSVGSQEYLRVQGVFPGSVADLLGLRNGDAIVAVNGHPVASVTELTRLRTALETENGFTVTLRRHDVLYTLRYTIIDE